MNEVIEQKISNLIQAQFPAFYNEEGPVFIEFVKAYYEWMEESGKPTRALRDFLNLRDIDDTLDEFLYYFQKKYLYGIPFDVIINKRLLLKHVLDVYRSKSSLQCFKLLFKLIYNEDMTLYLPGRDVLRASDGTWNEPYYVEISESPLAANLVGKEVVGIASGTRATVESYVTEPVNKNIISILYLSNIFPKGGSFEIGEKVVDATAVGNASANLSYLYTNSPTVIGSLDHIEIINGGQNFKVGDTLRIVHRDVNSGEVISSGIEGEVKVASLTTGRGQLNYSIPSGGFGYTTNTHTGVYRGSGDTTGVGASFKVGSLASLESIEYNTDLLANYLDLTLSGTNFPGGGNINSIIGDTLSYANEYFGSIASLTQIATGNSYTQTAHTFVRTSILTDDLAGSISYTSAANTITGTGTDFTRFFEVNDTIYIQANSSLSNTIEYHVVQAVTNATSMTLYGKPTHNSTATAVYRAAPNPLEANFLASEHAYHEANVYATPSANSTTVIATTKGINSGKGYVDGEFVKLFLYGCLDTPEIIDGGTGYANNDPIVFAGGDPNVPAKGYITTDGTGTITSVTLSFLGSGYQSIPRAYVKSANGTGASFSVEIKEFNTSIEVTGKIVKGGIGKKKGYWSTTRGFLNADKYIHDSYYYQDFSYQINTAVVLNKYRDILYDTFHIAGTEMFGEFQLNTKETTYLKVAQEPDVEISSI